MNMKCKPLSRLACENICINIKLIAEQKILISIRYITYKKNLPEILNTQLVLKKQSYEMNECHYNVGTEPAATL